MNFLKHLSTIAFLSFSLLFGFTFAQSLPGGQFNSITTQNNWFANQERVSTVYTSNQCLPNDGVYKNMRLYLSADQNNNGLKDYKPQNSATYHLKDNMLYYGDANLNRRLALISAKIGNYVGSSVYYYTPVSNMLSLWANNTTYSIDSNRVWYRYSKVAPINQPVRAITSEPVLIEQPSTTLNPLERMIQVTYQLRYATFQSVNTNATSDYQLFPVANMDDFSSLGSNSSWFLKNPIPGNNGYGPMWSSDYLQTPTKITTQAINRGPEQTHGLECLNMYLSRCGDGYIDVSGQQPTNGSSTQPHTISDGGVAEQCDPGATSAWTDDVLPGGVPATATYNCSATCTIVGNPAQPPYLTIDKQQKLLTGTVFSGVGLGTPSDIAYTSPSKFEFKIIITNTGGDATNVVMYDTLPVGFVVDTLPGGCSGTTSAGVSVACNAPSGGQLTSQAFNLSGGQSATFTIIGTLTSSVPTVNRVWATYIDPTTGGPKNTPIDVVDQHPQNHIPPQIVYTKTVRNVTTNSNGGSFVEADNLSGGVLVNTGDTVEYEITIQKLTGTVVNTILSDVLPTNNGFIMSGYSINGGSMIAASLFPVINITALLNSGNVVVKLYGAVGNPTATQFVNTALLTENGLPAGTVLPGSNVAWTYLPTVKSNPKLHLQKYWINPNNPNQTGDHYSVPANTPIKFILRVTNIGNIAAAGVITDVCPTNLTCQSYRILPSAVSVGYSSTIPVGTVAVGGYVEVEVSAIAYPNGGTEDIRNLAKLYRVCTVEEDIADGTRDSLCHENDDDATLEPQGTNQCGDGVLQRGEQCDLKNMPATIGNYLDLTFSYPSVTSSFNHRGKICNTKCEIVDPGLNRCGDGKLGRLEQCDMGDGVNPYLGGTIGSYLDNIGQQHPSGTYNGSKCSASCRVEKQEPEEMPACWYGDTIISIMEDEYFPFSWDIELPEGDIVNSCGDANSNGKIVKDSLKCDFRIYNRNGEAQNSPERLKNISCYTDTWGSSKMFEQFRVPSDGERDPLFVKNPIGTYYIAPAEFKRMVGEELGEYKLSLNAVNYNYCENGKEVQGNPYARVCQVNFAVTDHYLMQKGSVSSTTNSDLKNYFLLNGKSLYEATDLKKVDMVSNLNYATLSTKLTTLTNNLIAKYEKIAVNATIGNQSAKKVPGQSIYIMEGGKTFNGSSLPKATTLIVKGDVTIRGDVSQNILLIANGTVKFELPQPGDDDWRNGCNPQTIKGIIVAKNGFVSSSTNGGMKNTNLNQPRCRKGNLMVYGALVGDNLEAVVNSRRSHLEHWFTFNQNGINFEGGSNGDSRVRAERRDEVYKGASVYIEQNPSLWRDVPPGADEFLRTLNISRN